MEKIIIDTDPGVDDALAIYFAIKSRINILALTTTFGNSTVQQTTRNASLLLRLLDKNIPIYPGADGPIQGKPTYAMSHGKNAFGDFTIPFITKNIRKARASAYLKRTLSRVNNITLVCLGPLTNLAMTLKKDPDLAKNVTQIISLSCVFNEKGNITAYAEFNTYNDPCALQILLKMKCPIVIIPANICRNVIFGKNEINSFKDTKKKQLFKQLLDTYIQYYISDPIFGGFKGGVMYDLLAIGYLLKPSLFLTKPVCITVNTSFSKIRGLTTYKVSNSSNIQLVSEVDGEEFKRLFFNTINQ